MLLIAAFYMALVGHLSMAVPLETPSSDLTQFFDSRIIGGSDAPYGVAPHMAALVVGQGFFTCGGSVITETCILTAAHCITALVDWHGTLLSSAHAVVGTNTWNSGGRIVELIDQKIHPKYDQAHIKNDGGLLIAKKEIKFTETVKPIGLDCGWIGSGVKAYVTGWGTKQLWGAAADKLQKLQVETISTKKCLKLIAKFAKLWGWAPPMDYQLEICTFHSPGHGMCHGDSGSALVVKKTNKLAGIVSWGFPCAIGGPDIFVRVISQFEFIFNITGNILNKY